MQETADAKYWRLFRAYESQGYSRDECRVRAQFDCHYNVKPEPWVSYGYGRTSLHNIPRSN